MKLRQLLRRALTFTFPTVLLVIAFSVSGVQDTPSNLFDPLYSVFLDLMGHFYQPDRIDSQQALYGALKGMLEHLEDPYTSFMEPEELDHFLESLDGAFSGVGIEITMQDDVLTVITPLVGSPAEQAGILVGDKILSVDGVTTDGETLSQSALRIRGEIGSTVVLTVLHEDGSTEEISIVRELIEIEAVRYDSYQDGEIAYIRILRFENDTVPELDEALMSFDLDAITGLILDLRNNAGGYMPSAIEVSDHFVNGDNQQKLLIVKQRGRQPTTYFAMNDEIPDFPIAILINRGTASASEITAGAIRDNNMGILIGQKSFGKGVIQSLVEYGSESPLPGSALKVTSGEYLTPSGYAVNGVGLTPDILVEEDQDPIETAIEWINEHAGTVMPMAIGAESTP